MAVESSGIVLLVARDPRSVALVEASIGDSFEILVATGSVDGLERLRTTACDAVVVEAGLSNGDSFELCSAILQDHRLSDTPVIFLAAPGDGKAEARSLELGAADCIATSVSRPVLTLRIRHQVRAKQARDELRRQVATDGLTGLANRRHFDEMLEREWRRLCRSGESLSLALADIDHFKAFNDRYGHIAGDDCLRAVAHAVRRTIARAADLPARYGGEEFVCILPETDATGARRIGARLREAVAQLGIPHEESPVAPCVTISVGVATGQCRTGQSPLVLLGLADEQLYAAKNAGRNRVMGAILDEYPVTLNHES